SARRLSTRFDTIVILFRIPIPAHQISVCRSAPFLPILRGWRIHIIMSGACKTPKDVLSFAKSNKVEILDLRFTDLPGLWHHISFPIGQLEEASFENGFGIDG